jgi:AcrR family transcriptional regulator
LAGLVRIASEGGRYDRTVPSKPELRWGETPPADVDAARERLLDSAEACFERFGVMKTTVEDVAAHASVSRATVYRYFDGRDELVLAVLLRENDRFRQRLIERLEKETTFADVVVEGIYFAVQEIRSDEHLTMLFAPDAAGYTASIAGRSEAIFKRNRDFLRPLFEDAADRGDIRKELDLDDVAEWILRIITSLLTVEGPAPKSPAQERQLIRDFVLPALVPQDRLGQGSRSRRAGRARSREG